MSCRKNSLPLGKTYLKTIIREIKGSFGRFIAIFGIVALGVGFLAGLLATTPDMKKSLSNYYEESRMADVFIKAAMGFTEYDVNAVAALKSVAEVMPARITDALVQVSGGEQLVTRIYGVPLDLLDSAPNQFLNNIEILEGRLPESPNECVVQQSGGYFTPIAVGSVLSISPDNRDYETFGGIYRIMEYTVTGIVKSPLYFSNEREPSFIGNGRLSAVMYVSPESYALPVYTDLNLLLKESIADGAFSAEYEELVSRTTEYLEDFGKNSDQIWHILDRNTNVSYVNYKLNAEKIADVAKVFPIFFLLVAALVALTTMTRMVEEERIQIGTLKALGYKKRIIVLKYLVYCGLTSVLGCIVGMISGFQGLPIIIYSAFSTMYHLPPLVTEFNWTFGLIACALVLICTMGATVAACYHSLWEKPAYLMLPRVPKGGKRIFLEYLPFVWKRMKFKYKATARNLVRYKKHFFMTIIGIGGCTSLILAGFGLRDSMSDIAHTQFEEILNYDLRIELRENAEQNVEPLYISPEARFINIHTESGMLWNNAEKDESPSELSVVIYIPEQSAAFGSYITLRNRNTKEIIPFDGNAVVLTEKMASILNLKIDDTFFLKNSEGKTASFIVSGIAENYVGSFIYIGREAYFSAFLHEIQYNTLLVHTGISEAAEQDKIIAELLANKTVSGAEFTSHMQESYNNLLRSINFVVLVLIFAAGGLAVIVLYNLTNININERNRELATLLVLGYHHSEVAGYIFREIFILTIAGTITGLFLGIPLHLFIVGVAETVDMMFGRERTFFSFVLSAGATLFFSLLVNLLMLKKLKTIRMVDSMKAMD
jgi:putative ABC transport system permease protein